MNKLTLFLILSFFKFAITLPCLYAESRNKVFGEVNIQDTSVDQKNSHSEQESEALVFAQRVAAAVNQKGDGTGPFNLTNSTAFYFSGLYLYCGAKSGACPFILDTVLAAEYFNNKTLTTKACPNMKILWEAWVKNGFEKRLPYLVSIGSSEKMKKFNALDRNRYLKCDETLRNFSNIKDLSKSVNTTVKLIEQIQSKGINIFEATGAYQEAPSASK